MSMSNPYSPQRREAPAQAFENIQDRLFRKFSPRMATGDKRPIRGEIQVLPDGMIGGRPIPKPQWLMFAIRDSDMNPANAVQAKKKRTFDERSVNAARFLDKTKITLLQLDKPTALDAANRVRYRPPVGDKPAPPVPWNGGYHRVIERDREYPKSTTTVSMRPLATQAARWQRTMFPDSSVPSSAKTFRPTR